MIFPLIYWILQVASVGTALSFAKFVYFGFIKGRLKIKQSLNVSMQAAIIGLAACCVLFGVFPGLLKPILPFQTDLQVYSASGVLMAAGLVGGGILLFALFSRQLEKESTIQARLAEVARRFGRAVARPVVSLWHFIISAGLALLDHTRDAITLPSTGTRSSYCKGLITGRVSPARF